MQKIVVTDDILTLGYGAVYADPEKPVAAELPAGWVETQSIPVEADTIAFVVYNPQRWESTLSRSGAPETHGWATVAAGERTDIQLRARQAAEASRLRSGETEERTELPDTDPADWPAGREPDEDHRVRVQQWNDYLDRQATDGYVNRPEDTGVTR